MLNKKVLMSTLTIIIFVAIASSETWAYFTSSITSPRITITTGKMSLSLENDDYASSNIDSISIMANNVAPGNTNIRVKSLKVINTGNVAGKLSVTAANARDSKGLGNYLTVKVGNQVIYEHGHPVEAILSDKLDSRDYVKPDIIYSFDERGRSHNEVQDDKFTCDIVFTIKSIGGYVGTV